MNDNDVIKGLEELTGSDNPGKLSLVVRLFLEDILSCINRLQAEVEQWKEEANKYQNLWCEAFTDIQTAKSEARREFAERLKGNFDTYPDEEELMALYMINLIDNLLEELEKGGEE